MRSLSRGIGAGLLSGAWLALLSLAIAPIYVHLLGIESYGLIGLYTAALAIGGVLDVALSATVSREIAWRQARLSEQQGVGTLLRSVEIVYWLAVSGIVLILLAAVMVFGSSWVRASALPAEQITGALALMLLSLAIQLPSGLYTASLIGLHRQARSAAILAGFGTLRGIGAALVAWGVSDDIRVFFLWHVAVGLVQIFWLRWQVWSYVRALGGQARFAVASLMSIRHAAGAMFLITAMGMMLSQMDKIVLAFLVSLESLGHYTLAWGLASGLTIIATPVVQGFGARFSALASVGTLEEFESQVNAASQLTYVLVIPPAVTIILYANSIMLAWVRNADVASASAAPLSLLALGTAMVACTYPLLMALYAKKVFKPVLLIQLVCVLLLFPLLLLFSDFMGIFGAAMCWSIYGVGLFTTYVALTAARHGKYFSLGLLRYFITAAVLSLAVGGAIKYFFGQYADHVEMLGLIGVTLIGAWMLSVSACANLRHGLGGRLMAIKISMSNH